MIAFILAGGKGTRLKEITKEIIPKPMVEILGKPILQ
ncbi:MAG: sugar phosphate nucleotidyltransferase, partial [Athalassotoga sp.]